jgi:Peptidase family M28/PDZ domain/PA domain
MTNRRKLPRWPALLLIGAFALYATLIPAAESTAAKRAESEARLKKDIYFLASDECEGRGPTTKGIDKAADYIAGEFKKAGLKPGGPDGSYFQPFTIPGAVQDAPAVLKLKGPKGQEIELKEGVQFYPLAVGGAGKDTGAAVVFAGYGTAAEPLKYNDYAGLDVEDKVVIVLRDVPRSTNKETPRFPRQAGSLSGKLQRAEKAKAAAIFFVNDADTARTGDDLLDFAYFAANAQGSGRIPAFHLKRSVLETMLKASADKDLATLEADIDRDLKPQSLELKGWTISFELKMHRDKDGIHLKNVVGVLDGNGPLAKETVVVGAHYDHLGYGGVGGSMAVLRDGLKKMAIHPGADDNGSGSTSIMELARRFAALPNRQGRRLVFMTYSGEELGLFGSDYYCKHPLFPLESTTAMFNLDMVGRLPKDKETLLVEGSTTSKTFDELVDKVNESYGFQLKKSDKFIPNSDHASFYRKKIPVLFLWTGEHPDYHKPSDTADKINIAGMRKIVDMSEEIVQHLATVGERPDYVAGKVQTRGGGGNGPRLGITPTYNDEKEGVLLSGVADDMPAAKAGLKAGDRIVELAGKPIKNVQTYMDVMSSQKAGNTLEAVIERDGKKMTVKIKLE